MAQVRAEFSGGVVAEPEDIADGRGLKFPVYVNHQRKDKDTGDYVDTGDTTKIAVTVWGDLRDEVIDLDIRKGDIVEVKGTLVERAFTRSDGSEGRSLQTEWVDSVVVKWRNPKARAGDEVPAAAAPAAAAPARTGF